jgi:hypothetical protein
MKKDQRLGYYNLHAMSQSYLPPSNLWIIRRKKNVWVQQYLWNKPSDTRWNHYYAFQKRQELRGSIRQGWLKWRCWLLLWGIQLSFDVPLLLSTESSINDRPARFIVWPAPEKPFPLAPSWVSFKFRNNGLRRELWPETTYVSSTCWRWPQDSSIKLTLLSRTTNL